MDTSTPRSLLSIDEVVDEHTTNAWIVCIAYTIADRGNDSTSIPLYKGVSMRLKGYNIRLLSGSYQGDIRGSSGGHQGVNILYAVRTINPYGASEQMGHLLLFVALSLGGGALELSTTMGR